MATSRGPYTWPDFFPHGVPPPDAIVAIGRAFRLVSAIPSTAADFRSSYEEAPHRDYGASFWKACGTSFHSDIDDSRKTRARFKALRMKRIAVGELRPEWGVMMASPTALSKSHLTVWF